MKSEDGFTITDLTSEMMMLMQECSHFALASKAEQFSGICGAQLNCLLSKFDTSKTLPIAVNKHKPCNIDHQVCLCFCNGSGKSQNYTGQGQSLFRLSMNTHLGTGFSLPKDITFCWSTLTRSTDKLPTRHSCA